MATHFCATPRTAPAKATAIPTSSVPDRFTVLEGTVQVLASSLLGLTVQCARCHDHKFEPVTQREYYELQSIFWPAYNPDDWRKPKDRTVAVASSEARNEHREQTKSIDERIKKLRDELGEATKARA